MTQLYTTNDVKQVREFLLEAQDGNCALTKLKIPPKQACLDHDHKSNYVRAVLHRQANASLGKLENIYTRYLSYWYPGTLSDFLRQSADYLEESHPEEWLHPGWLKSVKTRFNKLNSKQKNLLLELLGEQPQANDTKRKVVFAKLILNRELTYDALLAAFNAVEKD